MKKIILPAGWVLLFLSPVTLLAQLTSLPSGGNKRSVVAEQIGITDVTIKYNRPAVRGREGKIWGELVPYGFTDQGFGTSKSAPWRAGANESTTISFSTDVMVEGKPLKAGEYALFIDVQRDQANIIFNSNTKGWGSYFYDPGLDVLNVSVQTRPLSISKERLAYEFMDQTENSAVIALLWEKRMFPFKVEVALNKTMIESFRRELTSFTGFRSDAWRQAAQFCADRKVNLEEALQWADYSINAVFVGEKSFQNMQVKANVLNAMGRTSEADAVMKDALAVGNEVDIHQYARQLLQAGKKEKAIETFNFNAAKHPNTFTTNMGLVRAMSAKGDYKNALKLLKKTQPQAPDQLNRDNIVRMIKLLEEGKDINN